MSAFWGALVISVVEMVLNALTGIGRARARIERRGDPPNSDPGAGGPVIDV